MDLYSLVGADQHVDPDGTRYLPDPETGGFHFPDETSDLIGGFAVKGKKLWETETERADRLHGLDLARRRDPATMLTMQEENVALMRKLTELTAQLAASQIGQAPPAAPSEQAPPAAAAPAGPADSPGAEIVAEAAPEVAAPAVKPGRAPKAPVKTA